jgi:hypothetical protein
MLGLNSGLKVIHREGSTRLTDSHMCPMNVRDGEPDLEKFLRAALGG